MASNIVIARPYAKAVFEFAQESNAINDWAKFLEVGSIVTQDATIALLLKDPTFPADKLLGIYQAASEGYRKEEQERLLHLLVEKKRLYLFPDILQLFHVFRAESEKTLIAQVISYDELSESQQQAIKNSLKKRLSREIQLQCQVDKTILGGAIIRAGDIVIDGSVRSQLEKLREEAIR